MESGRNLVGKKKFKILYIEESTYKSHSLYIL